jgi:hypothetical protein
MPKVAIHTRWHFFPTNETSLVHTVSVSIGLEHGMACTQPAPLDNTVTDYLVEARVQFSAEAIYLS